MLISVWFSLFILSLFLQLFYAFYFFSRIRRLSSGDGNKAAAKVPVSIIICAKNEAGNLKNNLPAILSQRYENHAGEKKPEVIVVDDGSTDDTATLLGRFAAEYPQLKCVFISPDEPRLLKGKKFPLSRGVARASNTFLLLTDADCLPSSENWLSMMMAPFVSGKELILGYSGYRFAPGLLNAFIRWETMHTFLQYSTYALAGLPYMAVGRNLACTKASLVFAQKQPLWNQLPSGDDDLLVNICATPHNTAVVAHPEAFTFSSAKENWREWLKQKQRHVSAGKYYRHKTKLLLGLYAVAHAGSWMFFLFLVLSGYGAIAVLLMSLRCLVFWTIWQKTAVLLGDKNLGWWLPLCDLGWLVYNFVLTPFIFLKSKQRWN